MTTRAADTTTLTQARERYKLALTADTAQDKREQEDLAFYAGEQWPADILLARQGQQPTNGMPAVPARPALVINKVREPIRQIQNEIRDADIGVEITPADDFGDLGVTPDDTEITLREGLLRRIQRDSDAQEARNWAGDRADIAGRGYYLVMFRYLPGKTNDQEIYLERLYNQAGVKLDPSRTQPDGSDADWGFIGTWLPWDRYKSQYKDLPDGETTKDNPFSEYSEADFMGLTEQYPDWYKAEDGQRAVRVVDYYYTERVSRELCQLEDGTLVWKDDLPAETKSPFTRTVVEKQIKFCKIGGGIQILDETDWPSPEFPIIEVVGEELHPYDGQRRCEGMVRPAMGAQRGFNYMVSKWVEQVGLTPIPTLQLDPDAIDGYEAWYAVLNTRTLPYAPYRTYDDQGRQLAEPHRLNVDPNLGPMAQSVALFDQAIKSTTAVPDPTLGNVDPTLKSGRAIRETVNNAKGSTSNFLSNRIRSLRREAIVINSLLYPIYGQKPGRLVRAMTGDSKAEPYRIGSGQTPGAAAQAQSGTLQQQAAKVAKLTKDAMFNVAIKVTKNFDTRRQQEASVLGDLISAEPTLMTWFGDLFLQSGDSPNRKQLAERAEVMLAPPIQAMRAAKEQGQALPPAAQAKIAQLTEQIQHAEAAMQELQQAADGKQLDAKVKYDIAIAQAQADVERTRLEADRDMKMLQMKNATAIDIAKLNLLGKGVIADQQAEDEALALGRSQAHEATLEATRQQHDREMATDDMAHDAALSAGAQDHAAIMASQQQEADAQTAPAQTTGVGE